MATMRSEISVEEAAEAVMHCQTHSSAFNGFDAMEVQILAQKLSFLRFTEADTILLKGEGATWFGILLSGHLSIELPNQVLIR